jgi:hypothetical protein
MFGQFQAASDSEALISDTESVGDSEEQKINEQVKAINLNTSAATDASGEYSEAEEKKADEFKAAGNEFFKGKCVSEMRRDVYKMARHNFILLTLFDLIFVEKKFREAAE